MPHARLLSPTDPGPAGVTARLNETASPLFDLFLTPTAAATSPATLTPTPTPTSTRLLPPAGEVYLQVHSVLIITIFSAVCLLLLVAFFYAFCFRCSIQHSPKARRPGARRPSLDPENATYRRSSSDGPPAGNAV